ncbi:MAG: DNA-directed RNA polymerase [Candidatus Woesearchaeota archaeon]
MFYKVELKDHIRIPPDSFGVELEDAMVAKIKDKYDGFISRDLGIVIDVLSVKKIGDGVLVPGDGAQYYKVEFELITYEPEMQEVMMGTVRDIADFGVFMNLGPIEGMIHVSQTMDDFVSFTKDKVLQGKDSKRSLKMGDVCRARMIAISYKDIANPKLGLTMRQPGLGKLEWIEEDLKKDKKKK